MVRKGRMHMELLWSDRKRTLFGLPLSFTVYELEEERLFIRTGFLKIREDEIRLYRILDLTFEQSLGQRIFGVGTIHCCSSDATMKDFDIRSVKNAREVRELLSRKVEEQRQARRVLQREEMESDGHEEE